MTPGILSESRKCSMRALSENAVQENWIPEDGERRASERQNRGAESTLTGREIENPPRSRSSPLRKVSHSRRAVGIERFPCSV